MHAALSDYVEYVQTNPASPFCKKKMKVCYASNISNYTNPLKINRLLL